MPELFRMPLVPVGTFHAPQGPVRVTPERVDHWIKSHEKISSKGYKIPQPWGHQLKATPANDKDAFRYTMSRWNAGFVNKLEKDDKTGALVVVGEVPPGYKVERDAEGKETGRLVNESDSTVIAEMSAGIGNWKDGAGEEHRDVIVHAAFCTLPVVGGQPGFSATLSTDLGNLLSLATLAADGVEYLYTLGTGGKLMDDDPKPKAKDPLESDIPATSDLDMTDLAPVPDPASMPAPAPMPTNNLPMPVPDAQAVNDVMALLASASAALPNDTTPQNFLDRLKVVLTTLVAAGYKFMPPQPATQQPQQAKIDTGSEGATPETASPAMAYMSSDPENDAQITLSSDASAVVEAWAVDQKKSYTKAFEALNLPAEVARQQLAYLEKAKPALDPATKRVSFPEVRDRYELAKAAGGGRAKMQQELTAPTPVSKPASEPVVEPTASLSTAIPEPMPASQPATADTPEFKEYMAHLIESSGLRRKSA